MSGQCDQIVEYKVAQISQICPKGGHINFYFGRDGFQNDPKWR